jgi:cytochrome P450
MRKPLFPSYLAEFNRTRPEKRWPLVRRWMAEDPRGFFAEIRAKRPILVTDRVTLISKNADVREILALPKVFTVDLYKPKMGDFMLAQDETIVNTRDKGVMQAMLSRSDLPKVREMAGAVADAALDAAGGRLEVVGGLARHVPLKIVQRYFGIEGPDDRMIAWSFANQLDQFNNLPFDDRPDADAVAQAAIDARKEMVALLMAEIPKRLAEIKAGTDRDDVFTRILRTSFPPALGFDMQRVIINVGGLLIGAIETTQEAVCNALSHLASDPRLLARAKAAAGDPAVFDGYVWEALRFSPIVAFMFRHCVSDTTIAAGTPRETKIKAGTTVLPLSMSAMFDADAVEKPDRFDPARPEHVYLHFGLGHHACLGRYVGQAMIPEIVRRVLLRDDVRILEPLTTEGTAFPVRFTIGYRPAEKAAA